MDQPRGEGSAADRSSAPAQVDRPWPDSAPLGGQTYDPRLLTRLNERGFRLVQVADAVALLALPVVTMMVIHGTNWPTYSFSRHLVGFVVTSLAFIAALYFGGLYEREPRLGQPPTLPRAARQTLAAGGVVALSNLALSGLLVRAGWLAEGRRAIPLPTPVLVTLIVVGPVLVAGLRRAVNWQRRHREGPVRVLLVGSPDDLLVAARHLEGDADAARVAATTTDARQVLRLCRDEDIDEVILLSAGTMELLYPGVLLELEDADIAVLQRVTARETMFGLTRIRQVGGMPFVLLRSQTLPPSRRQFKRLTDLALLALLLPVFLPLLVLTAVLVRTVAGAPVLFWQTRVGAEGATFRMVKFRTMRPDAEEDGNPQLATQEDPRIIRPLRWLRAARLDELPQLWNIVRGEMSLVGPRPERPEFTDTFSTIIPGYARRHEIPPGLTGLAQIHGRYHTDPEYKLGYDLQYLVNWSPVLDVEILLRTVWVVVTRRV